MCFEIITWEFTLNRSHPAILTRTLKECWHRVYWSVSVRDGITHRLCLPLGAFVWKTFKKWCSFVRCPSGDFVIFAIFAFTVLTWPYMGHRYCLLKKIKCSFLEPSSLIICQDQLWWLYIKFFQKLQKSPRVVSGGKMRKRKQNDSFPHCKNVQKYIFLGDESSWSTSD